MKDCDGKSVYQGYSNFPAGIPSDGSDAIRMGGFLVEFGSIITQTKKQAVVEQVDPVARKLPTLGIRRSGLSRGGASVTRTTAPELTKSNEVPVRSDFVVPKPKEVERDEFIPPKVFIPPTPQRTPHLPAVPVEQVKKPCIRPGKDERDKPRTIDEIISLFTAPSLSLRDFRIEEPEPIDVGSPEESEVRLFWEKKSLGEPPAVPATFASFDDYRSAFVDAITFELNAKVQEVYKDYIGSLYAGSISPPKCKQHGPTVFRVDRKGGYYFACKNCKFYQPLNHTRELCCTGYIR